VLLNKEADNTVVTWYRQGWICISISFCYRCPI